MSVYLPRVDYSCIPPWISIGITFFSTAHGQVTPISSGVYKEDVDFAFALFRLVGRWIAEGKMNGHPYEILPRGLRSVEEGLKILKEGNVSSDKLIYRAAGIPCIQSV